MSESGAARSNGWRFELAAACGFALLAAFASGITSDLTTRMYGGGRSDPAQDAWVLSRLTHQMLHDPAHLFEGNIFFPAHHSLLFCDPLLGPAVLVLPLRLVSSNPVLLYNAAVLLSLALGAYAFYRLALLLHGDRGAALLAGVAIPFGAQQMARLWHLNLLSIGFFPVLLLGLLRVLEGGGAFWAILAGLAFALQAGTSGYHAFSALFLAILIVAWHWRRLREPRVVLWLAVAGAIATLALLPYIRGFADLKLHEAPMVRGAEAHEHYSLDLPLGLLGSSSFVWGHVLGGVGRDFFPGLTVIAFALLALRRFGRDPVRLSTLVLVVFLLVAAGPEIRLFGHAVAPGPFALLARWLPFFGAVRHPLTFAVPAMMALGLLASLGLEASRLSRSRVGLALVLAAAFLENAGRPPLRQPAPLELPEVYAYLRSQPPGAILEVPIDERQSMWWSIQHGLPIVNGGGAFRPTRYTGLRLMIRRDWPSGNVGRTAGSVEFLKAWFPARYVVLRATAPPGYRRTLAAHPGAFELLHESARGDRVYRLRRGGSGRVVRRAFREDQLGAGTFSVRLGAVGGAGLRATLNGSALPAAVFDGLGATARFGFPRSLVQEGLNVLQLRRGGRTVDVVEVEAP